MISILPCPIIFRCFSTSVDAYFKPFSHCAHLLSYTDGFNPVMFNCLVRFGPVNFAATRLASLRPHSSSTTKYKSLVRAFVEHPFSWKSILFGERCHCFCIKGSRLDLLRAGMGKYMFANRLDINFRSFSPVLYKVGFEESVVQWSFLRYC